MRKTVFVIVLLVLLFLSACQQKEVSNEDSTVQVENLYKATEAINKVKEVIEEAKEAKKNEIPAGDVPKIEELPSHSCAVFSKADAVKFCNMPLVGSEFLETELHDTCNQQFRTEGFPYQYVNIRTLTYKTKEEAEKKLKIDYAAYQGNYDEKNKKLFWRIDDEANTNMGEFLLGKKIVRINEMPKGSCMKFEDLVKSAFARGG